MKKLLGVSSLVTAFVFACGGPQQEAESAARPAGTAEGGEETAHTPATSTASATLTPAPTPAPATLGPNFSIVPSVPLSFSGDELTAASAPGIASVAALLADKTSMTTIRIEGHVTGKGAEEQTASEARARAVAKALVAQGVDCKRLLPVGFGGTKPRAEERSMTNTRIELVVAALRDRAIGGMPLDGGGRVAGDACR
jgi:OOP family OmpA-OmpF porin